MRTVLGDLKKLSLPLLMFGAANLFLIWTRLELRESEKIPGTVLLVIYCWVFLLAIPAIFNLKLRRYLLIISPLVLLVPLILLNISLNKQFPNHWLLLTTWYDRNDAFELFREQGWRILIPPVLLLVYCWWVLKAFAKGDRLGRMTRLILLVLLVVLTAFDLVQSRKVEGGYLSQLSDRADIVYPWGIVRDFIEVRQEIEMIEKHEELLIDFSFEAISRRPLEEQETYVLFLGETARYKNWSINGYNRKTNPRLEQLDSLIVFSDMSALASTTVKAIPLMLTSAGPENFRDAFKRRSFLTAFKEAGFKVYWLSNLHRFGEHDTNTSIYAEEADSCIYNEKIEAGEEYKLDQSLLPLFSKLLEDSSAKKLVVVHTLGSHFNYTRRYTSDFDVFLPSGKGERKRRRYSREELINAYDNSILYTDFIISSMINDLKNSEGSSMLWYLPDHGENLLDDSRRLHLHGITNYFDLHVPSFFWYNDTMLSRHPDILEALKENSNKATSMETIFHTMPDLAGISFEELDPQKSLADSSYKTWKRTALSLSERVVDYEKLKP